MLVYISMTLFAVFFSYLANVKKYVNDKIPLGNKIFWYLSELVLIIVSGIRYGVGQDYFYTYVPYFNNLLIGHRNLDVEIGFYYLCKFIQIFTYDYAWLFIICSVIFFHFIYKAILEQSKSPTFSIFLLVVTTYIFIFYNGMRQMMAIAIFLYAIKFIQERNLKKYIIYMLLASLLHYSALLLIPLYFLYDVKLNGFKIGLFSLAFLALKPVITNLSLYIISLTKYNYYIGSRYDTGETSIIMVLINVAVLLFSLFFINKIKDKEELKKYNFYVLLQFISAIIAMYGGCIPLLMRLRWATGISVIILIPFTISLIEKVKGKVLVTLLIITLYSTYALYTVGAKNYNKVLPYHTIFERRQ